MVLNEIINEISKNIFADDYTIEESEKQYVIKKDEYSFVVDKNWLENIFSTLEDYELHEFILFKKSKHNKAISFETSVYVEENYTEKYRHIKTDKLSLDISQPPEEYVLSLFSKHKIKLITFNLFKHHLSDSKGEYTFNELIDAIIKEMKFETLKIRSKKSLNRDDFIYLADSFIFYSAYKCTCLFSIENPFEIYLKIGKRIELGSFYSFDKLMAPKYQKELLNYYKTAILTRDPFIQFICYYHILEYFFNLVSEEFKKKIKLAPLKGFESEKKELKKILKNNEFNDGKMLSLVLMKFINKDELKKEIDSYSGIFYSPGILSDYYFNNPVNFANAKPIDEDSFYETLSERIRRVRNSLVHRKEGKKKKYLPFKKEHQKELEDEIRLIRSIATQIMIKSGL